MAQFVFGPAPQVKIGRQGLTYGTGGGSADIDVNFLTGGSIAGATFARAGVATRRNASSLIENVAADTLRYDYGVSNDALGLLIERQVGSQLLQSGELGTSWSVTGATITANQAVGPTGATEMDSADEGVTNARHLIFQSCSVNNTDQTTVSGFIKDVDRRYAQLSLSSNGGSGTIYAYFDLLNGVMGDAGVAAATATFGSAGIIACGNGIYFVWLTGKITGSVAYHQVALSDRLTHTGTLVGGVPSYLGTSKKVLLWGFDSITNTFAMSYIPTTTAAVIRNADSYTESKFSSFAGRRIIKTRTPRGALGNQTLWSWDDGTTANRLLIRRTSDKHVHCIATVSSVDQCDLDLGVVDDYTSFEVDFSWDTGAFSASLNGGTAVTDASGSVPPDRNTERYGSSVTAAEEWNGHIERYRSWARPRSSDLRTEGDSYVAGANGAGLKLSLRSGSARLVANTAVGGSNITQARDRLISAGYASLLPVTTVFWDGSPNSLTSPVVPAEVTAYSDALATGLAALGHSRFVVIPAAAGGNVGSVDVAEAIRDMFLARWPNNTLDWRAYIPNTAGAINSDQFQVIDNVHLIGAAYDGLVVNGILPFLASKGW